MVPGTSGVGRRCSNLPGSSSAVRMRSADMRLLRTMHRTPAPSLPVEWTTCQLMACLSSSENQAHGVLEQEQVQHQDQKGLPEGRNGSCHDQTHKEK